MVGNTTFSVMRPKPRTILMELKIENMTCGSCANSVTKAIQSVDPTAKIKTNAVARLVTVETTAPTAALQRVLEEAGYPAVTN